MTEAFATTIDGRPLSLDHYIYAVQDTLPSGPYGYWLELKATGQCPEDDEGYCVGCYEFFPCTCSSCKEIVKDRGFVSNGASWSAIMNMPESELLTPDKVAMYV